MFNIGFLEGCLSYLYSLQRLADDNDDNDDNNNQMTANTTTKTTTKGPTWRKKIDGVKIALFFFVKISKNNFSISLCFNIVIY